MREGWRVESRTDYQAVLVLEGGELVAELQPARAESAALIVLDPEAERVRIHAVRNRR